MYVENLEMNNLLKWVLFIKVSESQVEAFLNLDGK